MTKSFIAAFVTLFLISVTAHAADTKATFTSEPAVKPKAKVAETDTEKAERKKKEAAQKRIDAAEQQKRGHPKKATALRLDANALETEIAEIEKAVREAAPPPAPQPVSETTDPLSQLAR